MMTSNHSGSVLITGPTSGLGRALTLELAGRAEADRPNPLLVGKPGDGLTGIADAAQATGTTVETLPCD